MATNNQTESALPIPGNSKRTSVDLLPRFFRTEANKKFLQSTLDQLNQPGVVEKINSYFGRVTAKSFLPTDNYIPDVSDDRQNYQLEPAIVIKDNIDNVVFYKDYNDYINQLSGFGANTSDHSRLNTAETYGWNPNIDWDKFVNFREYYWVPEGPLSIPIFGQAKEVVSTYTVELVDNGDNVSYLFTPDGLTANPTLKLYRGQTYRFEIDTPGHPLAFSISRTFTPGNAVIVAGAEGVRSPGLFDAQLYGNEYDLGDWIVLPSSGSVTFNPDENVSTLYPDGIRKLGTAGEEIANVYIEKGVIEFTVPFNAPDNLFYISKNDIDVSGKIKIFDIEDNTFLDVNADILGKKTYLSSNGVQLSNGMKVYFRGNTTPASFEVGSYYVEGVGSKITLIKEEDLIIPAAYTVDKFIPYDSDQFDRMPFSNASTYASEKDYVIINRGSKDRNAWTRYNRWFHKDVLVKSFEFNHQAIDVDESYRARRPIIEFEAGLKLNNFGTFAKQDVDLVDTFTKDVFSTIEGQIGYNIDGVNLAPNMRVLFTADTDPLVKGKIYTVKFITLNATTSQISLIETEDTEPLDLETVFVTKGIKYAGKTLHYHGDNWILAQEKTQINQSPLFDLCCPLGNPYSDQDIFNSSTFRGTKIFSYKVGTGTPDPELGFPLTYRNLNNTGDIVFDFNLLTDTFTFQTDTEVITVESATANLRKYKTRTDFSWVNSWSSTPRQTTQKVIRQYVAEDGFTNNFEIDVYDNAGLLTDLRTYVFVNRKFQLLEVDYEINRVNKKAFVTFITDLNADDVVLIKTTSSTPKNSNGWYEIPINLERNPLNEDITSFTLGEVIDHVDSMIEDIPNFSGTFPGMSNIRDLGELDQYGKRFVKHSGPLSLPLYHITNKEFNIIKAVEFSKNEYAKFKRVFVETATNLGYDGPVKLHVDKILSELNTDKVKTQPFYFSDMLSYGSFNKITYEVLDPRTNYYSISTSFSLNELSPQAINVYLNGKQLQHEIDYTYDGNGFVLIDSYQKEGDIIEIFEYESTDGSFIPPTPTKLGLYPKFAPEITIDTTFQTEQPTAAGPFKIYGEIDTTSDLLGERGWFYPVYTSKRQATNADANNEATALIFKGLNKVLYIPSNNGNFSAQDSYEYDEYPYGIPMIQGHDGSLVRAFKDYRDELLLEFENRIFNNIKSLGEAILTVEDFVPSKFRKTDFTREEINSSLLNDFSSWLKFVSNDYTANDFYERTNQFTFNYSSMNSAVDGELLPGFWRAVYKELYDTDRPHSHPWELLGFTIKPAWWNETYGPAPYTGNNLNLWTDLEEGIVREPGKRIKIRNKYVRPGLRNFIPVDSQGNLRSPIESNYAKNFFFRNTTQGFVFGDNAPVESAWRRSSEYPFALIKAWILNQPAKVMGLGFDNSRITKNLAGQYVYKTTFKNLVPAELVFPNTIADSQRTITTGLVNYIYNLVASNVMSVYEDYKNNVTSLTTQLGIKVGGFTDKSKFKLILDSRAPLTTQENNIFVPEENYKVFLNTSSPLNIATYSGVIIEKAPNGYVVRGYNDFKPSFEYYDAITTNSDIVVDVGGISETTVDWEPGKAFVTGQLIINNFKFYRATENFISGSAFSTDKLVVLAEIPVIGGKRATFKKNFNRRSIRTLAYGTRLKNSQEVVDFLLGYSARLSDVGFNFEFFNNETQYVENWDHAAREFLFWTTQGWTSGTTITLSPGAKSLLFSRDYAVADNIFDEFYNYGVLKADGRGIPRENISVYRSGNSIEVSTKNTSEGIYHVSLPLVQKEHVILIDNKTVFNDLIYQPSTGYRQERLKVLGYRSDNWDGSLNIPGFIYDEAIVTEWKSWKDYNIGDLVKYKQFYYVALYPVVGSEDFNSSFWYRLNEKPVPTLYTNFDYKINQFADFYDLDSDNFDAEQQRMAQHLIGYQKRNYLANIIQDDVSQYKFYQGFIQDKGTKNALTKLFDPLSSSEKDSLEFYEEWAIQVGRYGAVDDIQQVEYILDEEKIQESPQCFELTSTIPADTFDKVYRLLPKDVYDKEENYNHAPFPTTTLKEYILSGGYVHDDDIQYKAGSFTELSNSDINQLDLGEYIWLTRTNDDDWQVYQISETVANAVSLIDSGRKTSTGNPIFTVTLDQWAASILNAGDVVAIKGAQDYFVNGIYEVDFVNSSAIDIVLPVNNTVLPFNEQKFVLLKLRKVRVENLDGLNSIVQEKLYDDQIIWVDDVNGTGAWGVYKNTSVYTERQTLTNPAEFDSTAHEFSSAMAVTNDNLNLFVSAPGYNDGIVYYFRRVKDTVNLVQDSPIEIPKDYFNIDSARFGESVAVSPDGKFLAVGIPNASNTKTLFKGDFNAYGPNGTALSSTYYEKNDIVRYRESLWKVNRRILPEIASQPFSTFDTYIQIASQSDNDSTTIKLLVAGNPGTNIDSDHILIRAPIDMYLGTQAGDKIKLAWNIRSFAYPTLDNYYPFDEEIPEITVDVINNIHTIQAKIDSIFFVDAYVGLPEVGDLVTTDTGSAQVYYVATDGDSAVIYVNNITGSFEVSGELYVNNDQFIGFYTEEDTVNVSSYLGGYWLINISDLIGGTYNSNGRYYDIGRGLVYVDVLTEGGDRTEEESYEYYNIQTTVGQIGTYVSKDNQASFIAQLSYYGATQENDGEDIGPEVAKIDNRWVVRGSKAYTDILSALPANGVGYETEFRLYNLDNRTINLSPSGLSYDVLNKQQTVYALWDGYIDFELDRFDSLGYTFQPQEGDILEDVQTPFNEFGGLALTSYSTSTARVTKVQRNFNSVRVYVTDKTGNWRLLNNIGKVELRRKANTTNRGASDVDRIIGSIENFANDVVLGNTLIGKLIVFEKSSGTFAVPGNVTTWDEIPPIVDEEYWFFDEDLAVSGAARGANPPNSLNKDYTQIYNIPASKFGIDTGLTNEGAVALYYRLGNGSYSLIDVLTSEYFAEGRKFGTQLKFAKRNNLYTLFVSSVGNSTRENPGSIEIFKHGYNEFDNFAGVWNPAKDYSKDDIVEYLGNYYKAVKDITVQTLNSINSPIVWNKISWSQGKDPHYRGELNTAYLYAQGAVVSIDGRLYRALTNIAAGSSLSITDWELITDELDYLGYLPNLTGNAFYDETVYDPADNITRFSKSFDVSAAGDVLVAVSILADTDSSIVGSGRKQLSIYRRVGDKYTLSQVIDAVNNVNGFADSVAINPEGTLIAIAEPYNDDIKLDQGKVYIYKQVDGRFVFTQTLESPQNEESETFGYKISFSADNLVVTSLNGDMKIPTTFDTLADKVEGSTYVNDPASGSSGIETTFDRGFTSFRNVVLDTGVVYIYENVENSLVFSESFRYSLADSYFGENLLAKNNHVYVGMPRKDFDRSKGNVLDYRKNKTTFAWNKIRELINPVDISKIRGVFLYNKRTNQIVTYLDYIDAIQGKIAGPAEQEITHKVGFDPAVYNISSLGLANTDAFWAEEHVGEVWWNLRTARFTYPYQGDIKYQNAHWNELQPESSIDVYEWVESDVLPSQWDEQADTDLGLQLGISGVSVYGDSQYSQRFVYDNISQTFRSKFYFWVERKLTVPSVENRTLSVFDIARLIARPREQGYRFVSFTGNNRFILNNCNGLIYNKDIVLNVRYSTGPNAKQNLHSAYYIMSDGLSTSQIHPDIERKWIDSLVGYDIQNRPVPDVNLTVKQKYGVQNKPRQSMFVNRFEALKQAIERINIVLKQNIIVDEYDITPLTQKEMQPLETSGEYDVVIDTSDELRFVGTNKITPAKLTPVIINGRLIRVDITDSGRGYKTSPSYKIVGKGTGAEIAININSLGQVTGARVVSRGTGYDGNTLINVRPFTVLVNSDENVSNKWALYSWDSGIKSWYRKSLQDYDVSLYWDYVDWYADGYNEFSVPTYTIEQSSDLQSLDDIIGDVVKIKNVGSGGWLLLEKEADEETEDYTINYKTVGRQNGTLQFKNNLYDYSANNVGYSNRSYDSSFYDSNPINELRIIFDTIKNKIFINTLRVEYNKLFFSSLRYILAEQSYVDWMFKTSFVKAKHNLGLLEQDVTFNTDTLPSYRSYVEEVKPYKTVIREFVSAYEALDNTNSAVSDFDLAPAYSSIFGKIRPSYAQITQNTIVNAEDNIGVYPRKFWSDNHGYSVKEIVISDSGSGFTYKPVIKLVGGGGTGAKAEAYLGYGKITAIKVTYPGKGYTSAPTVVIEGSQVNGTPAKATAIIGNGVVRTPTIKIKFDRTSGKYYLNVLEETETFYGSNVNSTFNLKWPMDLKNNTVSVYIDGAEQLRSTYTYTNVPNTNTGYNREQGQIKFANPPAYLAEIKVHYRKPLSMLSAEDRIQFAYDPLTDMFGKDLAQLMDGVDYGGVEVTSYDFTGTAGWDTKGWYNDTWDTFDNSFEDQIFTFDGSTSVIEVDAPFETGTTYNVYLKRYGSNESIRIDDPAFGTEETVNNPNAVMPSIIGDGEGTLLDLGAYGIEALDGDVIIIRKTTSDGSFIPDLDSYDAAISGGDLVYSTAKGINAEEILVDGDGFVTPTTSKGPEELVPGQILDSVDIKVYTRDSGSTGVIYSQSYVMQPGVSVYNLGVVPGSKPAVIVKINNRILDDLEYNIDWSSNTVVIFVPLPGAELNIITMERTGQNILDFGRFISNGNDFTYDTTVAYVDGMSIHVTLNGVKQDVILFRNEETNKAAIKFDVLPEFGRIIHYTAFSNNTEINYSQVIKDSFVGTGVTNIFELSTAPFYSQPSAYNVMVKVDNRILNAGYSRNFTIPVTNDREFLLEAFQQPGNALQTEDIKVFLNGSEISAPVQWRFDVFNSSVIISPEVGEVGDLIEVYVVTDGEYQINGNVITFDEIPGEDSTIDIYQFSNHNILGIERFNYDVVDRASLTPEDVDYITYNRLTVGEITLRKPAADAQYVWISLNGELLTPNVDYYITDERTKVRLVKAPAQDDAIDVIHFAAPVAVSKFAYRQFKDMLNRTHYKRLDSAATLLATPLNYYDLRIEVQDGSTLPEPNRSVNMPGIIFIQGERIEYLVKEGNTLRQLRRGTLGTGVKDYYEANTPVFDQGSAKTVPYRDVTQVQEEISTGVLNFNLNFIARTADEFEVFVAGKRLTKTDIVAFNPEIAMDSPEGDETLPPEFRLENTVDSNGNILSSSVILSKVPPEDSKILFVRKVGKLWTEPGVSLGETQNDIGYFLRAGTTTLPE